MKPTSIITAAMTSLMRALLFVVGTIGSLFAYCANALERGSRIVGYPLNLMLKPPLVISQVLAAVFTFIFFWLIKTDSV